MRSEYGESPLTATDPATLSALLERVEQATGADREIDGLIAQTFGELSPDAYWMSRNVYGEETAQWVTGGYGGYGFPYVDEYTASVDAALELVGRVCPGWFWSVEWCDRSGYGDGPVMALAQVAPPKEWRKLMPNHGGVAWANTPALALLAALLRAKIAETEHDR